MLFALLSGTYIKGQPVPHHLYALKQMKETKTCLKTKKLFMCAREECLKSQPIEVNARQDWTKYNLCEAMLFTLFSGSDI